MNDKIISQADSVLAATYSRHPLVLTRGDGCRVWDSQERPYIDFVAGIAVCNLGHAHAKITNALCQQAEKLLHVSNLFYTEPQVRLARLLVELSFADRVFFCNSGAEANEAALKLTRKYFKEQGAPERYRVLAMERSFHGRTMATLAATGQDKIKKGFEPILTGFDFIPFNDVDALKQRMDASVAAVMLEPIQGEGGVRCPSGDYLQAVRHLCDETGALLIFDEIQTGMGRTGRLFAYEHFGVEPDIMTLAKALGNGLPIGAMLARQEVADAFGPGSHASTFGGTPIVTAAAVAVIEILTQEGVVEHCRQMGQYFKDQLQRLSSKHAVVQDVRGEGLLLGMRLAVPGSPVVNACMQKGFLINCIQDHILRFIPPLIISQKEIDALIACLDQVLGAQ
jgi:acetylornithine aminotransferase